MIRFFVSGDGVIVVASVLGVVVSAVELDWWAGTAWLIVLIQALLHEVERRTHAREVGKLRGE